MSNLSALLPVLKIKILYLNIPHTDLGWAVSAMAQDLEEWYDDLPPVMQLQEVARQTLPLEVRRSIYLVHLIYLGTNVLLFRRIAFQTARSSKTPTGLQIPWQLSREQYLRQADEASLAASGSAKIIKIMMDENFVFKRCWLVMLVKQSILFSRTLWDQSLTCWVASKVTHRALFYYTPLWARSS